jgi:chromosome partitioning protein
MYSKIINPVKHGNVVYDNKSSAARLGNYLNKEPLSKQEKGIFFNAQGNFDKKQMIESIEETDTLHELVQEHQNLVDFIFIDAPRLTNKDDIIKDAINIFAPCDSILIPTQSSSFSTDSMFQFLPVIKEIEKQRTDLDLDFYFYAFLNQSRSTNNDKEVLELMKQNEEVPFFDTPLSMLEVFVIKDSYTSIFDKKGGKEKFEAFFKEFVEKFKIEL